MIYLDNNSTTAPNRVVMEEGLKIISSCFGNPSSTHKMGREADLLLESARHSIMKSIGAKEGIVIFTSGGTEANNLALSNGNIFNSSVEHSSGDKSEVLIPVSTAGVDLDFLEDLLYKEGTCQISCMHSNNETGLILDPHSNIGKLKGSYDFLYHIDAVSSYGKTPINVEDLHADSLSISAHKIHGLKGVGALWVRDPSFIKPLFVGGSQEYSYRAGTQNMLGAITLGLLAKNHTSWASVAEKISLRRLALENLLSDVAEPLLGTRVCNTSNMRFAGIENEIFLEKLSEAGLCVSGMSACSSGFSTPSRVLTRMFGEDFARSSVRFSLSSTTSDSEINSAAEIVKSVLKGLGA